MFENISEHKLTNEYAGQRLVPVVRAVAVVIVLAVAVVVLALLLTLK